MFQTTNQVIQYIIIVNPGLYNKPGVINCGGSVVPANSDFYGY